MKLHSTSISMRWHTLVLDLDNTIYTADTGVFDRVDRRIQQYLTDVVRLPPDRAAAFRAHAVAHFGTTLRGLRIYFPHIDPMDFLVYAHDIDLEDLLQPDPGLRDILQQLPQRKVIFTNSDRRHTERVLTLLGVVDLFDAWVTIEEMEFIPKPYWEAYATLVRHLGHPAARAVYIDDLIQNLLPAARWGFRTVLLARRAVRPGDGLDIPVISSLHDLPDLLARL